MTTAFTFTPTTLIVLEGIVPCQVCRVQLPAEVEADDAIVRLERGGEQYTWQGTQLTGDLLVPEVTTATEGVAHLTAGSQTWRQTISFDPVRRWTVCLVNHSHTDIGFTHPYLECIDIHVKNLRLALELVDQTGHWPDATRFRWTVESAWQLQHYLRRYPEDRERLARAVRAGFIEVEALYIHSYFDILSSQQLVHSLAFAEAAREELGIPITSAMICDVPGCAWSLVDLFAQTGIQYLSMAINNFIAPFHAQTNLPRPFVWEGPAGGRVTTWYGGDPTWAYIEGPRLGFWDSIEAVSTHLPARLCELEADGYPCDIVQIQVSSDNRPLRLLPATIAREWNARYLSPTIEITTPSMRRCYSTSTVEKKGFGFPTQPRKQRTL